MDKIEKLLRKINQKDRQRLEMLVEQLVKGDLLGLQIKKVRGKNCFRVRSGRFRIIFKIDQDSILIMDIKLRNEKTYK